MNTKQRSALPALAVVVGLIVLQGCAGAGPTPAAGPAAPPSEGPAAVERHGPAHTEADVRFMRHMIHHHRQAVEMTDLVDERAQDPAIRLLAERIAVSQQDEMERMRQWLRTRGEETEEMGEDHSAHPASGDDHAGMHAEHRGSGGEMMMPGMLGREEMARLAAASGAEFDRLFLEYMIRHHQGALMMVEELFASPGAGEETEMYQFASEVVADQQIEIDRMRRMLASLPR